MVVSGILLTIKSWRYRGPDPAIKWPDRAGTVRVLVNLVSLALYIFLIDLIGMPLSTTLFVGFLVWYLRQGRHRLLYGLVTGVLSGLVVHYLFIRLLELSFPVGFLAR
jgi:hypothetical protein